VVVVGACVVVVVVVGACVVDVVVVGAGVVDVVVVGACVVVVGAGVVVVVVVVATVVVGQAFSHFSGHNPHFGHPHSSRTSISPFSQTTGLHFLRSQYGHPISGLTLFSHDPHACFGHLVHNVCSHSHLSLAKASVYPLDKSQDPVDISQHGFSQTVQPHSSTVLFV